MDDDDRWAEARRILDGLPSEALESRVRHRRRLAVLLGTGLVLLAAGAAFAVLAWLGDEPVTADDDPRWRTIAGLVLTAGASVLVIVGAVNQWRANRRLGGLRTPLVGLDRRQQKLLLDELRGVLPLDQAHVGLVRHLAERQAGQRALLLLQLGLLLSFVAQFIVSPSGWRLAMVLVFGAGFAVIAPMVLRNEHQARRFLAEHPDPRMAP
ncbi:hypothetical protein [Blastococcus saxobsidens]|uniref:Uncharacterized protein n=1 Tax=Blastococcus saxobsidens TaxID=138336 RepID=A0A4Q7Y4I6_9ACTN|nr:hypothetical protein [Blastococcus saxobsidens]RZU30749.1 hypothetical protein BKA19_0375 [Blastococcus saxobsidens]